MVFELTKSHMLFTVSTNNEVSRASTANCFSATHVFNASAAVCEKMWQARLTYIFFLLGNRK